MHPLLEFGQQNLTTVIAVEVVTNSTSSPHVVDIGRIIDLSEEVDLTSRHLDWQPPKDSLSQWRIMAWYQRYTNQRSIDGGPDAVNFVQNGSLIIDWFSPAGAERLTKFFDEYLVPEQQDQELLSKVGQNGESKTPYMLDL
jgi:hypothetical protein